MEYRPATNVVALIVLEKHAYVMSVFKETRIGTPTCTRLAIRFVIYIS